MSRFQVSEGRASDTRQRLPARGHQNTSLYVPAMDEIQVHGVNVQLSEQRLLGLFEDDVVKQEGGVHH